MRHPHRDLHRVVTLLAAVVLLTTAARVQGQTPGALIDLPYFSQTRLLCGGAALTMVLRYWGALSVVPDDFRDLVDEAAGGITTGRLADAARTRGWQAIASSAPVTAPIDAMARHVRQGRPVIALIEDSPGVDHYVVVAGVTATDVVLHDPARAPYRVLSYEDFDRRWQASSRWMLLVLPGEDMDAVAQPVAASPAAVEPSAAIRACDALLARGVDAAREDQAMAERVLRSAIALCPVAASPYRELAGLRFVQERWAESHRLAAEAVRLDPADRHAWQLLATARFLDGDRAGALKAWDAVGEPTIDNVTIDGLRRTSQPVVTALAGLRAGQRLTPGRFARAARRVEEFPSASRAWLAYTPLGSGRAAVTATVNERRLVPAGWLGWSSVTIDALLTRIVRVDIAAPFSQGDLWQPSLRWPRERRRVGLDTSLPLPGGRPGLVHIETFWERQTYARAIEGVTPTEQERRRIGAGYSDWVAGALRLEAGLAADRFGGQRYTAVSAGSTARLFDDHIAVQARGEWWIARDRGTPVISRADVTADWRSTTVVDGPRWLVRAGASKASPGAPLALWPGAGSSLDRTALLRGRQLVRRHVLSGEVFGRRLVHASAERQQPLWQSPYGAVAVAGFVDAARAFDRLDDAGNSRLHVDVGAGVRLTRPGDANQIRLDLGVGLRDGHMRVSAGYVTAWGRP